jgi:hypothetical protein
LAKVLKCLILLFVNDKQREDHTMLRRILLIVLALAWTETAIAAGDYPIEQYELMTQCISDPSCNVGLLFSTEPENRIDGAVGDAEVVTWKWPICMRGNVEGSGDWACVPVCTTEACWCEEDDKC